MDVWYSIYWCRCSLSKLTAGDDDKGGSEEANWCPTMSSSPFQLVRDEATADKGDGGPGVPKLKNWSLKGSSTDPISELSESSGMSKPPEKSEN